MNLKTVLRSFNHWLMRALCCRKSSNNFHFSLLWKYTCFKELDWLRNLMILNPLVIWDIQIFTNVSRSCDIVSRLAADLCIVFIFFTWLFYYFLKFFFSGTGRLQSWAAQLASQHHLCPRNQILIYQNLCQIRGFINYLEPYIGLLNEHSLCLFHYSVLGTKI